ncbi:MAG: peptidoglycan DD-metalloendopeptidase family protein [Actinobacteria bacterium]|nr:peptidoglycan DD-metalloendopeptidase family protein [Actinomycetota bacterium]
MRSLLLLLSLLLASVPAAAAAVDADAEHGFALPVAGEVVSGFDAPLHAFGAGHRGVDIAAVSGTVVRAPAAGRVGFADVVAGARWVTLDHGGGLRTSYGELARIDVAPEEEVAAGAVLGTVGTAHHRRGLLHWSARRGRDHIDPLLLLDRPWVPTLVGPGGWSAGDVPDIPRYAEWDGRHRRGFVPASAEAEGPGYVLPPNPNHVIAIAGLGSRTGEPPLDATHLGYDRDDVTELSYAGAGPDGEQLRYDPADTWRGVEAAALRLRDELRRRWDAEPGRAVDLVGHSMGGVVAMYYLLVLHDPADPTLPPIGHVATVASPLEGADLAVGLRRARRDPALAPVVAVLDLLSRKHDVGSPAMADLVPGSDVVGAVTAGWEVATADVFAGPLATGTRVLTTGGSRDLVVPEHRSDLPGADHIVLPGAHDGVRATEAVRIVLHEFLAGAPVPGEAGGIGSLLSHPVSWVEHTLPGWLTPW